jgi:hypothetical protein
MSRLRLHTLALVAMLGLAAGCPASQKPQLKVLGVEQSERAYDGRQIKLFVEVTNYANRPMRLDRLQYVFSPSGSDDPSARGSVSLSRTVDAGSAVVVEVPIMVAAELLGAGDLDLRGELITEQDQVIKAYPVRAEVDEPKTDAARARGVDVKTDID